ncbi:MAG: 16S rRNA (adenine(1518)-N(6)/adenine(1519)-N(6))-dimethyltransferase RsmA [Eubacteriales bacterium]|nr:16S rRNA (adenine(1518)-N(6)/adenine(1519)-N(6))-dimethyltransferase RsmA [Eubacteriales bacterium]
MEKYKKLINPQNTIELVKKNEFTFKKRFGQNFLIDEHVLNKIMDGAEITKEDSVLEIGPGIGTMTQALCERAGDVTAVEIDRDLIPILNETLSPFDNVKVINEDVLKLDLNSISDKPLKVVANLPYYITTPIVMELFESGAKLESVTVMVQKEVADRMQAIPGGKDYGALSLAVQYYAEAKVIANVPPNCFIPRPGVGSAVINLKCHKIKPVCPKNEEHMFRLIKAAFAQRRKTLLNALKNESSLGLSKERIQEVFSELGMDERIRGEKLSLADFAALSDKILK